MFLLCLAALGGCGTTSLSPRRPAPGSAAGDDAGAGSSNDAPDRELDPKRTELVLVSLSQVGLPYRWGGISPDSGFDCSGLVVYVFHQALRVIVPRTSYAQARAGRSIGSNAPRPGDLVFFNTMRQRYSHVGIYVGEGRFVHAPTANALVRLDALDAPYWRDRFDGARQLIA
ncbi:MAG: C40 family peptidase [Burkholderiales bacterium]